MSTVNLTDMDADTVEAILLDCHAPNEIEKGFTPDPIHQLLNPHLIADRDAVLNAIADRFPVYCTWILRLTDQHYRYHFCISNAHTQDGDCIFVSCDLHETGYTINLPKINIGSPSDAIYFAKGINAINEWAVEAA